MLHFAQETDALGFFETAFTVVSLTEVERFG